MKYNPDIHHRRSIRLRGYDYAQAGAYFVTICAHNRECLFGQIADGAMILNAAGRIAEQCWQEIPLHFPHSELDEWIIMPNHVHGIVKIGNGRGTTCRAPTMEQFGRPVANSLPTIVRAFKSVVTKHVNVLRGTPGTPLWQRNYWERVIRDDAELHNVREYICGNPARWEEDALHPAANSPF